MKSPKNCHQEAYKPKRIGDGIWMPSDDIDYNSKETIINKYHPNGLIYYEIKNGFEEKTTYIENIPVAIYVHFINSHLFHKYTLHYKKGAILKQISYISYEDKFREEHLRKEYFYEDESEICLHYLINKPFYYEKTTKTKDRNSVEYWHKDKTPYLKYVYYYDSGRLIKKVQIKLPYNHIEKYWDYEYDSKGNCVSIQSYNQNGKAEHCQLFQFDVYNNIIRKQLLHKHSNTLLEDFRNYYEYDNQGNWITKVIYKNKKV